MCLYKIVPVKPVLTLRWCERLINSISFNMTLTFTMCAINLNLGSIYINIQQSGLQFF